MSLRNAGRSLSILASVLFLSIAAYSQGVIIPRPCEIAPRCPRPIPRPQPLPVALPVKSVNIDVKIKGQVAVTTVVQVFENRTNAVLEGTYFFPIPEDASIEQFAIWENGKRLSGEVRSREEARRIYDEIVRKMRDPGLLEYAGKDLFQASIFPIPANSDKKLELTYSQILKADSGTVSYSYPLGTGSGSFAGVRPAAESSGVKQEFGSVSGSLTIEDGRALRNIYSPSHMIDTKMNGDNRATVSFESKGKSDDFRLFYSRSNAEFGLSLITYREPGKDGYFMIMVSPDDEELAKEVVNKDVVFVLDTSGSMQDDGKLEKARPALIYGIKTLNRGDRFNVISFAGEERLMETGLIDVSRENIRKSEEWINALKAAGGTNINDSLSAALRQFDGSNRPKMLVFLTDGLPTVGVQDVEAIIGNVKNIPVNGLRIFPFGVGYDVNTRLLDKLGTENSGIADYIEPKEELEVKVSSFFSKVSSPVLSGIDLDLSPVDTEMIYPRKITDLFRGLQLVLIGRYKNGSDVNGTVARLTGRANNETKNYLYEGLDFPLRSSGNDFLPRLWASRRVGWLIEEVRSNGENKELRDEIIDLGTRYGIVTPYTSYLATDGSYRARATEGNRFRMNQADGVAIAGELKEDTGRGAVKRSVQQLSLQANVAANAVASDKESPSAQVYLSDTEQNMFVGSKNFINDDGKWVDTSFDEKGGLPEVTLKFGSDEYFSFALNEKGVGEYLSIGKNVTFVWKGKVYKITE